MKHTIEVTITTHKGLFKMPDQMSVKFDYESDEPVYKTLGRVQNVVHDALYPKEAV